MIDLTKNIRLRVKDPFTLIRGSIGNVSHKVEGSVASNNETTELRKIAPVGTLQEDC